MSSTGVVVDDACVIAFNDMKMKHETKYLIFKITDDKSQIVIEEKGGKDKTHDDFREALFAKDGPRYCCLDFEYVKEETGLSQDKLVFIFWSPDNGGVKPKMLYAASKDSIKKCLQGVAKEIQANDADDISAEEIHSQLSRK